MKSWLVSARSASRPSDVSRLMESVGFPLVKSNGLCAIIDSHQHAMTNSGGVIIMADNPKKASK